MQKSVEETENAASNGNKSPRKNPNISSEDGIKYGQRLLPNIVDFEALRNPDGVVGMMAKSTDISQGFLTVTYAQVANATNFTAHWIDAEIGEGGRSEVIAFIGLQDFRYWIMEFAAMKTGHPILLPSPRNALINTISLLQATKCTQLFFAEQFAGQAQALSEAVPGLKMRVVPELEEMLRSPATSYPYTKTWDEAKDDIVIIVHTSGSTGAPKPIYLNNIVVNRPDQDSDVPKVEGRIGASMVLTRENSLQLLSTAFFHLSGISVGISAFFRRFTIVIGPADTIMTGKIALDIIKETKPHGLLIVPAIYDVVFIEHGEEVLPYLEQLEHACWFGGPLAQATGDFIVQRTKAHLWQIMGSTETHSYPMLVPPRKYWKYMEFHPTVGPTPELVISAEAEGTDDLYEIVTNRVPDDDSALAFQPVFSLFPHIKQWRSRDLVKKVEVEEEGLQLWSFQGRLDDQLILSTGLKVNPLHIETQLQSHALLKGNLVFGIRHIICGLLLEPKETSISKEDLIEAVWATVEKANSTVPEHARIQRHMVLLTDVQRPFVRAGKGTVVRSLTYKLYEHDIERLYQEV